MDFKKIILGVLLSFVFLYFFVVLINASQWFLTYIGDSGPLASVSSLENILPNESQTSKQENTLPNNQQQELVEVTEQGLEVELQSKPIPVSSISVATDLSDYRKVLYESDSDTKRPIASLTKLMTAIVVLDNVDLTQTITVSDKAGSQSTLKTDVKAGDSFVGRDLFYIMLIKSSNKAAYALAESIGTEKFVELMNQKVSEIRLENTFYKDPTGLSAENVSIASDLVKLTEYILKDYPQITTISSIKEYEIPGFGKITNTDQLLGEVSGVVCSKTGYTIEANGCLLMVIENNSINGYSINVVLGANDRFLEMKNLLDKQGIIFNK